MSDIEIARKADKKPIQEIGAKLGIPTEHLLPFGHDKAKVSEEFIKSLEGQPERPSGPGDRDQPDAGRRGQDHDDGGPRRRAERHRQEGGDLHPRSLARAELRHEGRRRGRRLRPGRADGGHEPPFHRRFPRDHVSAQPAGRDARQPHLLGQRTRHRHPPHPVSPRDGHERPGAAPERDQPGRRRQRLPARVRLRHHRGLGGHGDPVSVQGPARISRSVWATSSWPIAATARRSMPATSRPTAR